MKQIIKNVKSVNKSIAATIVMGLLVTAHISVIAAQSRSSTGDDFTINQRVHLNNLQDDITKVELKCVLTCKANLNNVQNDIASNLSLFLNGNRSFLRGDSKTIAGFSETINIRIQNGATNQTHSLKISADTSERTKKEHVTSYACGVGFYVNNRLYEFNLTGRDQPIAFIDPVSLQQSPGPLPAGVQLLDTITTTAGNINNLHNPTQFRNCDS